MKMFKYVALLVIFALSGSLAHAQVSIGVGVAPYGYAEPYAYGPPACPYGYYPDYPYTCAPYGYYGPQWFVGGVFIGAGPWYHRGFYGPAYGYRGGYYGVHPGYGYGGRGYYGRGYIGGERGWGGGRGFGGGFHGGRR